MNGNLTKDLNVLEVRILFEMSIKKLNKYSPHFLFFECVLNAIKAIPHKHRSRKFPVVLAALTTADHLSPILSLGPACFASFRRFALLLP